MKVKVKGKGKLLNRARLLATPWTAAYQAPLSMGVSRQENWSGLPLPSPEEIASLSHSIVFLYFFAFFLEEAFLISPCYSFKLCFQMGISSFSPLPLASLPFSDICKTSSDNYFTFLYFFFLGMVVIPASYTMSRTSVHSSLGTLSIKTNPLNLFLTSTV